MDMYKHLYLRTSLTFLLEGWGTGNRIYHICIAPFASRLFISCLEKVGHVLTYGCKSHLFWAHFSALMVYLLEMGSFISGRVSVSTALENIYHVLLLVRLFFCFNEIFFARNSSQREAVVFTCGLRKIYVCLHQ